MPHSKIDSFTIGILVELVRLNTDNRNVDLVRSVNQALCCNLRHYRNELLLWVFFTI